MKDYIKLSLKLLTSDYISAFLHRVLVNIKNLLESNRRNRIIHLVCRLKRNASYEIFTNLRQDQVRPNRKDILLVGEMLPWLSPLWFVLQKEKLYTLVF